MGKLQRDCHHREEVVDQRLTTLPLKCRTWHSPWFVTRCVHKASSVLQNSIAVQWGPVYYAVYKLQTVSTVQDGGLLKPQCALHDQQNKNGREEEGYCREIAQVLLHGRFDLGAASEEDQPSLTMGLRAALGLRTELC